MNIPVTVNGIQTMMGELLQLTPFMGNSSSIITVRTPAFAHLHIPKARKIKT